MKQYSNIITVSAPGKLMLFGEHAVVYGRPCIVTAVNQSRNIARVLHLLRYYVAILYGFGQRDICLPA